MTLTEKQEQVKRTMMAELLKGPHPIGNGKYLDGGWYATVLLDGKGTVVVADDHHKNTIGIEELDAIDVVRLFFYGTTDKKEIEEMLDE